jgi:hypothetical protein
MNMSETPEANLGPVTERRFEAAFANGAIITAKVAATLLGLDPKTLSAMAARGVIKSITRGKVRAFTERDLRGFLTERSECEPGNLTSSHRGFTTRPARLRLARPAVDAGSPASWEKRLIEMSEASAKRAAERRTRLAEEAEQRRLASLAKKAQSKAKTTPIA